MKRRIFYCVFLMMQHLICFSQTDGESDSLINNLIHSKGYQTSTLGAIPQFIKSGHGSQHMILIPGLGFDAGIFKDWMTIHQTDYTMYAITIPGFGKTTAPPMPDSATSYGDQTWSKGVITGILELMQKEKMERPILVGHFTLGTQIALRMAIDYPDKVGAVIVLGGQAKFIAIQNGKSVDYPLEYMIMGTDQYSAPLIFKGKTKQDWDAGNYLPEVYSIHKKKAIRLWKKVSEVPTPVMVRYLCEFTATDVMPELHTIKSPVLVLQPSFTPAILDSSVNQYVQAQFIDTWTKAATQNSLIEVKKIDHSACFVWVDQPGVVKKMIHQFCSTLIK